MNDLKEINEEFFKPYRTVMEYIALLIFIQLLRRKDYIKAFVFEMEKEWRTDESLSPELVVMKKKLLKETYLYNYSESMIVAYEMQCSQYIITISMSYLRILFLIIQVEFKEIIALKYNEDKDKLFKEAISRHSRLLDLLANVSTTFGCLFAINYIFLSSTICFCILSACVNGSLEDLKILSISLLVIINVFYCCKSGENLVNAASEVSTAIYDTPWCECSYQHMRDILFILMRSQRVAYVTSTSFIKISLKTFIRIMNMSWSFISLITTVYDKN
ncbi:odorant receptor 67c-like [Colias croceus]|uniref:odorant receptor 67c-like n=1 Tax=Colias crocea TaxID=72248 RepID=UPI001E27F15B|nr:odorant receptor 67c-like [Colias croceus]